MKRYKEVENGIEYEVFEFNEYENDYETNILNKIEYCKIVRLFPTYKNIYYFKYGEAHNDFGPAAIVDSLDNIYYRHGDRLKDEEWKSYYRTLIMNKMLNGDEYSSKNNIPE